MDNLKKAILTFGKAQFSAWFASAIDFLLTILLAKVCGLWYAYATFIGSLAGGIVNCIINYKWVFHANGAKKSSVAIKYFIVWTGSILLNTLGTYFLTELSGIDFIFVKAAVSFVVAVIWNYQLQRIFVFK